MLEIVIKGPGTVTLALCDRKGRVLLKKQVSFTGHAEMEARTRLPLVLETTAGTMPVVPIVVNQSREAQQITFDGVSPRSFIDRRCKELKWSRTATRQIELVADSLKDASTRELFPGVVHGGARTRRR